MVFLYAEKDGKVNKHKLYTESSIEIGKKTCQGGLGEGSKQAESNLRKHEKCGVSVSLKQI